MRIRLLTLYQKSGILRNVMRIHFFGGAREVTGSCFLLESADHRVLVDCGLFQGHEDAADRNLHAFPFDPTILDAVFVTHAHLDHCGRVPKLFASGYRGPVYATEPTSDLMQIMWKDALSVMKYHHERGRVQLVYEDIDVERASASRHGVKYNEHIALSKNISITFHDAGHILGSSWLEIKWDDKTIVFSGDIGNDDVPIVNDTESLVSADALVIEATYGDRTHSLPKMRRNELREVVIDAIQRGGALMIAAFSLERTQEILFEFDQLIEHDRALPAIPIYLDAPLAIRANDIYKKYPQYYDETAAAEWRAHDDFFTFPGLQQTPTTEQSKKINEAKNPKIIIAGSGMLEGGRITHHLRRYLSDPKSTLLLVSYQAEGTLGRKILDGARTVVIHGDKVPVHCKIVRIDSYSAHGDQDKLLRWIHSAPVLPKRVYAVHGDFSALQTFSDTIAEKLGVHTEVPQFGSSAHL